MMDLLVAIVLVLMWLGFMVLNIAAANRERDELEMRLKRNEMKPSKKETKRD